MKVEQKHIVTLQGKPFITYDGLLDMAHQMGLESIKTEMISFENGVAIFKATATAVLKTESGTNVSRVEFDGYGDADNSNVNSMIAKHKIRMAETRAKARALRDLTNVGMCSVEELGGDDAPATKDTAEEVFDPKLKDTLPDGGYDENEIKTISDKQQGRLFALAGYKKDDEVAKTRAEKIVKKLLNDAGLQSTKEITAGKQYKDMCENAELALAEELVPY